MVMRLSQRLYMNIVYLHLIRLFISLITVSCLSIFCPLFCIIMNVIRVAYRNKGEELFTEA